MEKMMESGVQRHAQSGSVAAHLDYREVERVFELDTSFNSGRAEIWQLVRNDLGEMNRFMRDGVLALREVKEVSEEQAHPSPGEGEMAQSVRTWLGADGSQSWLDHCQTLIARHVGVGAPTLLLSSLKTNGNLFLAELLRIKRSEEHTSDLQSLMRNSSAVFF